MRRMQGYNTLWVPGTDHAGMPFGLQLVGPLRGDARLFDTTAYQVDRNVLQMRLRQDFFAIEWPRRTRKWEYGIYADGVLQNYFPPAFGLITNISNG